LSTNVGPVISRAAQANITVQIEDALSKGAKDITPPNETFISAPAEGNYVAPRILIDVTHDMEVMREETFGPVLPIMKVSSDAEAITLMNDSDYGLTASVWTTDIAKGEELIQDLEAGTVFVNRCDYPNPVCRRITSFGDCLLMSELHVGSRLDRLEELWPGLQPRTERVRCFLQAEELSCEA
jgi:acyl-CoA reductase-like NAD-dependent aldehyde dehydrogenase